MPLHLETNKCMNGQRTHTLKHYDPIKSDSGYPALFCSLQCEREWLADCLAELVLPRPKGVQAPDGETTGFARC